MRIKRIEIRNFRRFTHLEIDNIPASAKLIVLAGPNGSGKSSFFDAFNIYHRSLKQQIKWDPSYYFKSTTKDPVALAFKPEHVPKVEFHDQFTDNSTAFYIRSAYRNESSFQFSELRALGSMKERYLFNRTIENDVAVSQNYARLIDKALSNIFDPIEGKTMEEFKEELIGGIRDSTKRLFPDLNLNSLERPLSGGTFRFTKGTSQGFPYQNLSGGEKAAFDLILDMHIKIAEFNNTVFCIDEPEAHMNTRLQADLLSVLYEIIPDNCQLILATHSIGMMRRAQEIEDECPGTVTFLDFGGQDFDTYQVMEPVKPTRAFWRKVYEVALDDLASLVAPNRIVICEGAPKTHEKHRNQEHDAKCYDRIFEEEFPDTRFLSGGNMHDVQNDRLALMAAFEKTVEGVKFIRLIDRDDRNEVEIKERREEGICVLSRRNLESYLLDDEVLCALAQSVGKPDKADDVIVAKNRLMAVKEQGAEDDFNPILGFLYDECKRILSLTQGGSNAKAFMRDKLAPLITKEMEVYQELKRDIFGENS